MSSGAARQTRGTRRVLPIGRIISAADFAEMQAGIDGNTPSQSVRVQQLPSLHEQAQRHGYEQGMTSALQDVATVMEL